MSENVNFFFFLNIEPFVILIIFSVQFSIVEHNTSFFFRAGISVLPTSNQTNKFYQFLPIYTPKKIKTKSDKLNYYHN